MKMKKALIAGIVAAVVILAAVLTLVLTQCGGQQAASNPDATKATAEDIPTYTLYWNLDLAQYGGKSEAGMSSRTLESDGYFHVRFFQEGQTVTLKVADRKLVNRIDIANVMGLELDENGIVVDVIPMEDMPLEMIGWRFFVQSAARGMLKLNSSENFNGLEILLEDIDPNRIWDMSGMSGEPGCVAEAIGFDRVMAVSDLGGNITHVFIQERPNYMRTHEGHCLHCDKTVTWNEWVRTDAAPLTAGHYQLMTDVQLKGQASMHEDAKICLDLNGHRLDGKEGTRLYSIHNPGGALAVMDTSEGQTGVIAAHGKTNAGGSCLWPRYGALYLYSGTVDASDVITTGNGAAVYVPKNSFFYMYGGTIKGGTADYTHNPEKNTYGAGLGGNVYVVGKFVLHDGLITGGDAKAATYRKDGTKTLYRGYGGNVYVIGEFEMNGGTIENGRAGSSGANIYATGTAILTIKGGAIKGGRITGTGRNGGSVFLSSKTIATMSGGSITGGVSYNGGGNVYTNGRFTMTGGYIGDGVCYSADTGKRNPNSPNYNLMVVNGRFAMYGGTIAGGASVTDSKAGDNLQATVTLSGYAKIDGGPNGRNLYLSASGDGVKTMVGKLYERAKIGVYTTTGLFTEPTLEVYQKNFYSDIPGAEVVYYNERLGLGRLSCICGSENHKTGCDGQVQLWAPWVSATSLPKDTGNYYLLSDVVTPSQTVVYAGKDVKLDLNGHDVTYQVKPSTADGFRLYRAEEGGKLTLTDTTSQPGTMRTVMPGASAVYPGTTTKSTVKDDKGNVVERIYYTEEEMRSLWAKGNSGMILWSRGGEINVHGGIFDGSNLEGASYGMTVLVNNRTITDATTGEKTFYPGIMNIYGGTIIGGYTKDTGNVHITEGATLNLYGGTIRDGRANRGGNMAVAGTFNMYGGSVTGGIVDRSQEAVDGGQGGNINVETGGIMNLFGGTVANGSVKGGKSGGGQGGNLHVHGTLNATGGTIRGGYASAGGGNIATISADSLITLDGVQVLSGTAAAGGNILIGVRSNKGLYLLGKTLISGGHATSSAKGGNGGNIAVNLSSNSREQDQIIVIDGATIQDGTSVGTGGNIRIRNLTADAFDGDKQTHHRVDVIITMRSGTISGGQSGFETNTAQNGGSVYLSENSVFILEDGKVTGGNCTDGGGNFYVNGTLDIRGGTVTGGTRNATGHAAANIFVVDGKLKLSGGTVDGNVTVVSSAITLSGKPVVNKAAGGGITLRGDALYAIDSVLQSGACVYTSGSGYISQSVEAGSEGFIHSVNGYGTYYNEGKLFLGKVACLCGGTTHTEGCKAAMAALGKDPTRGDLLAMKPVTATSDMADGGYWYLPGTVTGGTNIYVKDNKPLVLDLNGQTLNADHGSFLFTTQNATEGALLVITDTVGGGAVKLSGTKSTTAQGGILRVSGKSGKDVCYVLGGTLDASGYPLTSETLGGTVAYVTNGCTLKQYGGTLVGSDSGNAIAAGNTIHVKQGTYELLGGSVKGGSAKQGGNIYVGTAGKLVMSDGSVEGGQATENGNNIYVLGELTMTGGTCSGVYTDSDKVKLTGSATVDALQVAAGRLVDVKGLTGSLTVLAEAGRAFAYGEKDQANITSLLDGHPVTFYEESFLYLGKAVDIYCVCGATVSGKTCQCDGKLLRWTDWTSADALPSESGYYRLTGTVNADAAKVTTLTSQAIYLDLNGQTVNLENGEDLYKFTEKGGAKLVITDASANSSGKAVITGTHTSNGGFADILAGNTVELYRATLDASGFETAENGAVFAVRGSFVMHSGKLVGGKAPKSLKNGGALWMAKGSQVSLKNGQILGGEAGRWGGAIYVTGEDTKLTMENGAVIGGTAKENGGAIIVRDKAQFEMRGGSVTGGNLFVDGTGVFTMRGGSVAAMEINGDNATITGSATVDALTINTGKVADLTGLTGKVTVTAAPGAVFATGDASLAQTKVLSAVTEQGFLLPVLAKDGKLAIDEDTAVHCICGASLHSYDCQCDGKLYYWQPWTDANTLPSASGYYRLTDGVTLKTTPKLTTAEKIYLDFNGQTVTQQNTNRLYNLTKNVASLLVLTDSSKDGKGGAVITGTRSDSNGGFLDLQAGNTLELYRATLDASGFYIANGNGTAISSRGNFVMHSGTVKGGRLDSGTKHGATLWLTDSSQTIVKDGLIAGGRAGRWAGSVYIAAAGTYFKLEGGRVEGGTADELGGSFMVRNGTLHITGGTVTGGTVTNGDGANICIQAAGTLNMEGGTVTGGIYITAEAKAVTLTGNAIIDASLTKDPYSAPAYGLKLAAGKTANVAGLTGKVYITAEPGACVATGATEAMANVNVLSESKLDDKALSILYVESGKLHMGTVYCVCGASLHGHTCQDDGTLLLWEDWTDTTKLPAESGYWRLTDTVNVASVITLSNGETIYLDLNGKTVNLENGEDLYKFTANKNVRVVITDSSKNATGKVVLTGKHTGNGGFTDILAGNTVELYRGTLNASGFETAENGACLAVRGSFIMHSGTLVGGTCNEADKNRKNGGTLWISGGSVTIHDGLIIGGNVDNMGGAIYLAGAGQLIMENGTITGGFGANGGGHSTIPSHNIMVNSDTAILRITGGTITGGVHLNKLKEATITGGAIINKSLTESKYTMPEHSLSIAKGYTVNVAGLTGTVYVTATADSIFATGATAAMAESKVISEVTGLKAVLTDSTKLKLTAN